MPERYGASKKDKKVRPTTRSIEKFEKKILFRLKVLPKEMQWYSSQVFGEGTRRSLRLVAHDTDDVKAGVVTAPED
jgi:hypothetical protein